MAGNSFGKNFIVTSWGESHGEYIGAVVDGCPAGLDLKEEDFSLMMQRRSPKHRSEPDTVKILSGVFEGKTTGMPISLVIKNEDVNSEPYEELKDVYRPGSADLTYEEKYGIRDYKGAGRSSGRETAMRVAAGVIALKILDKIGVKIESKVAVLQGIPENDSIGGSVKIKVIGTPKGLGEPVFEKLDANLAKALMSIGGVKAVEIGAGVESSKMMGSESNDEYIIKDSQIKKKTNNAGGILGGISDGDDIDIKVHFKPTPSISRYQNTVNKNKEEIEFSAKGRFDSCIAPRGAVVAEAMVALTLVDALFENMHSKIEGLVKFYE